MSVGWFELSVGKRSLRRNWSRRTRSTKLVSANSGESTPQTHARGTLKIAQCASNKHSSQPYRQAQTNYSPNAAQINTVAALSNSEQILTELGRNIHRSRTIKLITYIHGKRPPLTTKQIFSDLLLIDESEMVGTTNCVRELVHVYYQFK